MAIGSLHYDVQAELRYVLTFLTDSGELEYDSKPETYCTLGAAERRAKMSGVMHGRQAMIQVTAFNPRTGDQLGVVADRHKPRKVVGPIGNAAN